MVRLQGANVLVVGMGKSGLAAVALLRAHGALVTATDSRPREQLGVFDAEYVLQDDTAFTGRDVIVLSPGVAADLPAVERAREAGTAVIGELELAGYSLKGPSIGITGSNGKTTTTALTGHILKHCGIACQVGGNIGTAPAAMVGSSREDQWNVLELSSFQLETIADFRARVAVALNVTQNHLDRHYTMERYAAAKGRLFETQRAGDFAVLNAGDPYCRGFGEAARSQVCWFDFERPAGGGIWIERERVVFNGKAIVRTADIPLRGRHNQQNVMAAAGAAIHAGAALEGIEAGVRTFPGVEHRLEFVRELAGVKYYNDSKATSVDATLKAIEALGGPLWVILGGKDKGSDYTPLREPLASKARAALLIGAAAPKIAGQLHGAAPLVECGTIEAAVERAAAGARPGDTVVLAPACASFDQFNSFEHRGEVFKKLVGER